MKYVSNLKNLVCAQVEKYIKDVMRPDDVAYDARRQNIVKLGHKDKDKNVIDPGTPRYDTESEVTLATKLVENNNPLYPENMINRSNTPFDHIERILLQDLTSTFFKKENAQDYSNYFRDLFVLRFKKNSIVSDITMRDVDEDSGQDVNFQYVNNNFDSSKRLQGGKFFIDSFTYTPYIDYAREDSNVGIYSDEFLTKYNTEQFNYKVSYDKYYNPQLQLNQVDVHRRNICSNLYQLRNLEKDLYDENTSFKLAIENTDEKVYIHTFCEHLMTLFAKLSNIRMSHLVYGFKTPHTYWDGMLALDIWYNLLYKHVDGEYLNGFDNSEGGRTVHHTLFNENYLDMNPMAKVKVVDGMFEYNGQKYPESGEGLPPNLTKMDYDDTEPGYVLIWDENLFSDFDSNSTNIRDSRPDHVLPRGVLKKIYNIVRNGVPKVDITCEVDGVVGKKSLYEPSVPNETLPKLTGGDFNWFYQLGKVYSDQSKSNFTKYTNLHLGAAYDVMTPYEYTHLLKLGDPIDGVYIKPPITKLLSEESVIRHK